MTDQLDKIIELASDEGAAIGDLWAAAYCELKQLARARLRRSGPSVLLDTTDLVNQTYVRLARIGRLPLEHRGQFFAYSARAMRSVIVDMVRDARSNRHGGDALRITLNAATCNAVAPEDDPLQIDDALTELTKVEPRLSRVVEMRYFGGFTELEIAESLGITDRTVRRDWERARVLLRAMLSK